MGKHFGTLVGIATILAALFAMTGPLPGFWNTKSMADVNSASNIIAPKPTAATQIISSSLPLAPQPTPTVSSALGDIASPLAPRRIVRIFVHVANSDRGKLDAVSGLQRSLANLDLAGMRIETPPVRLVASTPNELELRCSKPADCQAAGSMASAVETILRERVRVKDFSFKFEQDKRVREGNFELWIPAGRVPSGDGF